MQLADIRAQIPKEVYAALEKEGITDLRPAQEKAIKNGVLDGKSLLVCTPTASGKTLIAELAAMRAIMNGEGKAIYIAPLKALANEKHKEFRRRYGHLTGIALSVGDIDAADPHLAEYGWIVTTSEKLDSLLRHHAPWISEVRVMVVDEIHLLNDPKRGPTLEVIITLLRELVPAIQIIGLSATIGNPKALAAWLQAELVEDSWRPVELRQGVYYNGAIEFK
ncbi:MAG TPA: DEAD/DEAH box helicase [Candidatus Nanoarchaeia archaeon]|nr:DEAD/DEAH box helicase [Candidatus Nanoarchaeia archaeon]